jgi:hypothetical protein
MRQLAALLLLLLLLASLGGCARGQRGPSVEGDGALTGKPVILWIDWEGSARAFASPGEAGTFCQLARAAGVTHLALEARDADGARALGPKGTRSAAEANLRAAAKGNGLRLAAVLPMFLASPDAPAESLSCRAVYTGDRYEARTGVPGFPRRLSPAIAANREGEVEAVRRLAGDGSFDVILLSGCGFEDSLADLGAAARKQYESWSGYVLRRWPEEVIGERPGPLPFGPQGHGPYWDNWMLWRASVLRDLVIRLREAAASRPSGTPPQLALLVDAPYPAHQREGLNWAGPSADPITDFPWLPSEYAQGGAGHLVDAVALGFWAPGILSTEDAQRADMAWWASVDGASSAARRYVPAGTKRWGAVVVSRTSEWTPTMSRAAQLNDGVVVIGAGTLVAEPKLWESLAAAIKRNE